jgi:lipoate-protein ligase B
MKKSMATSAPTGKPSPEERPLWIIDLGRQTYEKTRELQKRLVLARLEERIPDVLLLLEHEPVFTMGRHGRWENLLVREEDLRARGIACIPTERGGDVTYHGPGQLVGYPVVRVPGKGRQVKALVKGFEDLLLGSLAQFGIQGRRDPGNPGVWVGNAKIGSIGIAIQRGVSFHGFSLNVGMDLTPFSWIHTCGDRNLRLTSLEELLGEEVSFRRVKGMVAHLFAERMAYRPALPSTAQSQDARALGLPGLDCVHDCVDNVPCWVDPEKCPDG